MSFIKNFKSGLIIGVLSSLIIITAISSVTSCLLISKRHHHPMPFDVKSGHHMMKHSDIKQ